MAAAGAPVSPQERIYDFRKSNFQRNYFLKMALVINEKIIDIQVQLMNFINSNNSEGLHTYTKEYLTTVEGKVAYYFHILKERAKTLGDDIEFNDEQINAKVQNEIMALHIAAARDDVFEAALSKGPEMLLELLSILKISSDIPIDRSNPIFSARVAQAADSISNPKMKFKIKYLLWFLGNRYVIFSENEKNFNKKSMN